MIKFMRVAVQALAVLLVMGPGLSGVGTAAGSDAATLRIGVGGPMTGPYSAFGDQLWRGASQAAEDINAAGGAYGGRRIEVIKGDDSCEPKQARSVANRLVDVDHVVAVIGHFCSSSTMPATEVYHEAGLLAITPGSTNPLVTERRMPTVFRTCGRDDQQGAVGADFLVRRLKVQRIAVLHDKDTYGQGLADAMRARLNALDMKEVLYEGVTRGEKDFNALVTKLKSVRADAVYFGGIHSEAGPMVRQMREQGVDIPFVSGDGIMSQEMVTSAGGPRFVRGVYMTFGADPRRIPQGLAVVERFRKGKYEPEGYTLYSYATMQAIVQAVNATKSTDGTKLAQWLHANTVETIMGPKAWDAKGDLKVSDYVIYRWKEDGSYEQYD
jgi:branched-chain amino acid transport system substrate-binding protein